MFPQSVSWPALLGRMAFVWLACGLGGGLAVACAQPGQVVAPLYLPAGLALAFLDAWGAWMLLPVALGGFTVSMVNIGLNHANPPPLPWLLAGVSCGLGTSLQAWVGWRGLTGRQRQGLRLDTPQDIGRFLLWGGAVACCINASVSVPALVHLGWIDPAQAWGTGVSWWGGDMMGVALGTPLALTLVGRPQTLWRERLLPVGLPLALATLVLSFAAFQLSQARQEHEAEHFQQDAQALVDLATLQLRPPEDARAGVAPTSGLPPALPRHAPYLDACLVDESSGQQVAGPPECVSLANQASHRLSQALTSGTHTWRLEVWNRDQVPAVMAGLNTWMLTSVGVGFAAALGALLLVMTSHARQLKHAHDEAQSRSQDAERANQAKSEFMSRMSHELRTPLNAVLGFAQVMSMDHRDPLTQGQRERLEQIQHAGWHLLAMIDDVLDIARLDTGMLRLHTQAVAVGPELQAACAQCADDVRRSRLTLHMQAERWQPDWHVMADASRLRQILGHLLSNAIKFNEPGGEIWLQVRVDEQSPSQLRIEVRDSGLGIHTQQLTHLFEPFNRASREHGPTEGRGVGLAISRHLAHLMGGELTARSEPGQGATFTLSLPLCAPPPASPLAAGAATLPPDAPEPGPQRVRRLLYVEDNRTNSALLRAALADRPWLQLTVAETGEDGLAVVHDRLRGGPQDLILLDVHLPDASGLELLQLLKANPDTAGIPVVMISADATPEQVDATKAAGAAAYLTKPVQLTELYQQIDALLG